MSKRSHWLAQSHLTQATRIQQALNGDESKAARVHALAQRLPEYRGHELLLARLLATHERASALGPRAGAAQLRAVIDELRSLAGEHAALKSRTPGAHGSSDSRSATDRSRFAQAIQAVPTLADRLIAARKAGWKVEQNAAGEVWARAPLSEYLLFDPADRATRPVSAQEFGSRIEHALAAAQRADRGVGDMPPGKPRRWRESDNTSVSNPQAAGGSSPEPITAAQALETIRTWQSAGPLSARRSKFAIEAKGDYFVVTAPSGQYVLADPQRVARVREAAATFVAGARLSATNVEALKRAIAPLKTQYQRIAAFDASLAEARARSTGIANAPRNAIDDLLALADGRANRALIQTVAAYRRPESGWQLRLEPGEAGGPRYVAVSKTGRSVTLVDESGYRSIENAVAHRDHDAIDAAAAGLREALTQLKPQRNPPGRPAAAPRNAIDDLLELADPLDEHHWPIRPLIDAGLRERGWKLSVETSETGGSRYVAESRAGRRFTLVDENEYETIQNAMRDRDYGAIVRAAQRLRAACERLTQAVSPGT
jgi:hypothetical protein